MTQFWMRIVNATIRDEANVKRLLRYSVGNPLCTEIEGCTLDVSAAAGTPLGSVLVMTDAGWAGGVKDRKSCSGKTVWVKRSTMETGYPVCATSKKQNMICLSSGESELMALVGGACQGIATRDQRSKTGGCANGTIVLCTDSSAALGKVHASLGHGAWSTHSEGTWSQSTDRRLSKDHDASKLHIERHLGHSRLALVCVERGAEHQHPLRASITMHLDSDTSGYLGRANKLP